MENAITKASRLVGGQSAMAKTLTEKVGKKISPQSVFQYCKSGKTPAELCIPVEQAVQRRVTRYQLRPDVFGNPPNTHTKVVPPCVIILLNKPELAAA